MNGGLSYRTAAMVQSLSFELHLSDGFDDDDAAKNGVDRGRKVVQRRASSRTASELKRPGFGSDSSEGESDHAQEVRPAVA